MRYIIHGAGAVGSLVGGLLADTGAEVIFIARPAQAEIINRAGLTIHSLYHPTKHITKIKAVTSPHEIRPQADDVLMLAVKSAQTAQCVHDLREVYAHSTPLFCLQNGMRNEVTAAERFLHVYGAMVGLCVNFIAPGVVTHTLNRDLVIGSYPLGCDEIATHVARDLSAAGFNAVLSEHVIAAKWGKLILNLSNAVLAITGHHLQLAHVTPQVSLLMAEVQEEGLRVIAALEIPLYEGNNPLDVFAITKKYRQVGESTPNQQAILVAENLPTEKRTYVSTWADLKQQRGETEVGYLNGEIMLLGEKHAVPTPYNSTLFEIVEQMAVQNLPPGHFSIDELQTMIQQKQTELQQQPQ